MQLPVSPPLFNKLFKDTLLFSALMFAIVSLYLIIGSQDYTLAIANRAFADTGFIIIGLSFAVSNAAKFLPGVASKVMYRRDLGLAGFAFVVAHGVTSLFLLSNLFPFPEYYLEQSHILPFLFAVYAFLIYLDMALISNNLAIRLLGGQTFRTLLRFGYAAYIFSTLHFALKQYSEWITWIQTFNPVLPPEGLLLFLFGLVVLGLRIATLVANRKPAVAASVPQHQGMAPAISLQTGVQGK
jgi:DMSO/TMAO reductase YedYZ heme-binding membrane subunit